MSEDRAGALVDWFNQRTQQKVVEEMDKHKYENEQVLLNLIQQFVKLEVEKQLDARLSTNQPVSSSSDNSAEEST